MLSAKNFRSQTRAECNPIWLHHKNLSLLSALYSSSWAECFVEQAIHLMRRRREETQAPLASLRTKKSFGFEGVRCARGKRDRFLAEVKIFAKVRLRGSFNFSSSNSLSCKRASLGRRELISYEDSFTLIVKQLNKLDFFCPKLKLC